MSNQYLNFDLLFETKRAVEDPADRAYSVRVLSSPVGETKPVIFALPFHTKELAGLRWLSSLTQRSLIWAGEPQPGGELLSPQQFGERLYQAVFDGVVGKTLLRSVDAAKSQESMLRIRLRFDAPELADLPWEYLYATDWNRFVSISNQTVIARYLEQPEPVRALRVDPPLTLLAVVSDPKDVSKLDVESEWLRLQEALAGLRENNLVRLERLRIPSLEALQDRLREGDVHILHFIGHGYFRNSSSQTQAHASASGLIFEDEQGKKNEVDAAKLGTLLHDHGALRLVFLNACEGARSGPEDNLSGTAQKLVQQGVPSVVAMQFPITDRAAIVMAQEFYEAIAVGYPVDRALAEARKALFIAGDDAEWGTPVLFSRSADNILLDVPLPQPPLDFDPLPFEPETVLVPAGSLLMGSDVDGEHERPQHKVYLPAYRIGKHPVTNAQYAEFIKRKKHPAPRGTGWFLTEPPAGQANHPVVGVSWHDASAYCQWLSDVTGRPYRLPTEAEWEKAARGRDGRRYPWGDDWEDGYAVVDGEQTEPVDRNGNEGYKEGANPYGCLDLLGNVQEWTQTIWGSERKQPDFAYPYRADDGRDELNGDQFQAELYRIHRGGSYRSEVDGVHCSARGVSKPGSAVRWRGFRVVMVINQRQK